MRAELETLAQQTGVAERIRFLGWRTDRGALLRAADICLLPSNYEPFGTVILDAWSTRTAFIACDSARPARPYPQRRKRHAGPGKRPGLRWLAPSPRSTPTQPCASTSSKPAMPNTCLASPAKPSRKDGSSFTTACWLPLADRPWPRRRPDPYSDQLFQIGQ